MRVLRNIFNLTFISVEIGVLLICLANAWVFALTGGRTYTKISKIPPREIALVLGTSPKMRSGMSNPYFTKRMDATALLYHHGKIKQIIVSGEKSKGYNEPAAMKNYLVYQEGVPEEIITEDPKGFNTYKSILRCKDVYKKDNVIIVSQGFHNLRALFFARNNNMNALGFDAQDVNKPESFYRNQSREILARVIAVVYFILGISPD
ncbi:vancomycin high temperature exclusion protein [Chryseobacterium sp. ERMR1:04]|uniref:SanA/YdcF family protein n=1 Tax=Chryseobacterium sp. ERMR1:04 TaxID=1705393 RepID=UPI0006C89F0C|nr:ElyC/SanA/YdcF family protein [Chryseobacterium sp. ERMR1:04]KPH14220.1 SanA protein [Chryseobacterium sp. ERMR1:04]